MTLCPLVLAAGQGSRFGAGSKLLAELGGRPVLGRVFDRLREAGLEAGFVAVPDDAERFAALKPFIPAGFEAVILPPQPMGMGVSLAALAARVRPGEAALMVMGDQPLLTQAALAALLEHQSGERIARLCCGEQAGHPVLFPDRFVPALRTLSGDEGPRALLQQHGYQRVEVDDPLVLCDVDTPEALKHLQAYV